MRGLYRGWGATAGRELAYGPYFITVSHTFRGLPDSIYPCGTLTFDSALMVMVLVGDSTRVYVGTSVQDGEPT